MSKTKHKFNWKSVGFNSLIGLLVIVGVACLFAEPIENQLVKTYHPNITAKSVAKTEATTPTNVSYDFSKVKSVSPLQVANARWHAKENQYVGQIVAPSIGLHLPIGLGVDNNTLMLAAGTMRPNMQMGKGNYALAGHHMKDNHVLFSPLYVKAHLGTKIYITDMKTVYEYTVNVYKIIEPTDVGVINDTKDTKLTLITCNDSGSKRLLVQGNLTNTIAIKDTPANVLKSLGADTNNHNVLKGY